MSSVSRQLAHSFRDVVQNSIKGIDREFRSGTGKVLPNPFTGGESMLPVSPAAKRLHNVLVEKGLIGDKELVDAIGELLEYACHRSLFGLLVLLDESEVPGISQVAITVDGAEVPGSLHEHYFERED